MTLACLSTWTSFLQKNLDPHSEIQSHGFTASCRSHWAKPGATVTWMAELDTGSDHSWCKNIITPLHTYYFPYSLHIEEARISTRAADICDECNNSFNLLDQFQHSWQLSTLLLSQVAGHCDQVIRTNPWPRSLVNRVNNYNISIYTKTLPI